MGMRAAALALPTLELGAFAADAGAAVLGTVAAKVPGPLGTVRYCWL